MRVPGTLLAGLLVSMQLAAQSYEVGDVVGLATDRGGAPATVLAVMPAARVAAQRATRELSRLQERHGDACRVVVCEPHEELGEELRARLDLGANDAGRAAVVDRELRLLGVVAFGAPLRTLVEDVLGGRVDAAVAAEVADLEGAVHIAHQTKCWDAARGHIARVRALVPSSPASWLAELSAGAADGGVDGGWVARALDALGADPDRWAPVLRRAIQESPALANDRAVAARFGQLAAVRGRSAEVCLAGFEWCAARGDDGAATAWLFEYLESCKGVRPRLAELAERLGSGALRGRFVEARLTAVDLALRTTPTDARLLELKLEILVEDVGDWIGARRAAGALAVSMHGDARALNSFAWRLLTEDPYRTRMREAALVAARAMETDERWRTYWRVDTLALAEFENGNLERAVALQEEAVGECDAASRARYESRLQAYRAALAAAKQ